MTANFFAQIFPQLQYQPLKKLIQWPFFPQWQTSAELLDSISHIRFRLRIMGFTPGMSFLILLKPGPDLAAGLLALFAEGHTAITPPAGARPRDLLRLVRSHAPAGALIQGPVSSALRFLGWIFSLKIITFPLTASEGQIIDEGVKVAENQTALLSHSSGSTGEPKAIRRSHAVLAAQHAVLTRVFPPWEGQVDFPLFPNVLLHNLALGRATVLPDIPGWDVRQMNPETVLRQVTDQQVSSMTGNVFFFRRLLSWLDAHPAEFPMVQAIGIGGSPVPEHLAARLRSYFTRARIAFIYGATEAEPICVRWFGTPSASPESGYDAGPFVPGLEWRIRENELSSPYGMLEVKGPHVAAAAPDGWHSTGDFGRVMPNGHLVLTGRSGNERTHAGIMHYQIEHSLSHCPGVIQAAARSGKEGFTVYFTGNATGRPVQAWLKSRFPQLPVSAILPVENLPVDARHFSKILYGKLPA